MISSLTGKVLDVGLDRVIIVVSGVGFSVAVTPRHALALAAGQEVSIHTRLIVREDDLALYGFESVSARETFELLTSVTGVGPKLAMTVLSGMGSDEIRSAINSQNEAAFRAISGVGPKTAKLIIISLAGKVGVSKASRLNANVLAALMQLGTNEVDAQKVLEELPSDLSDSDLLKLALAELGTRKLAR